MPQGFPSVGPPPSGGDTLPGWLRQLWTRFQQVEQAKLNCITSLTLADGVTTTALSDPRISSDSEVYLFPRTANAAGALATTYLPTANKVTGTATFVHANAATTDRSFGVAILG